MGSGDDTHRHRPIDEAAVRAAEAEFLAAREAWRRERGDAPPPDAEPPADVRRAEQAFIAAREIWQQDREREARKVRDRQE